MGNHLWTAAALAALLLSPAAAAGEPADAYHLGVRDLLQVSVYQQPDLTQEIRIGEEGSVTLPLVGQVHAAGFTAEQFAADLTERYREYLRNPQITVFVKEYAKREITVSILGEVGRPGLYKFRERATLMEVISEVGGLTRDSGDRVVILRTVRTREGRDADAIVVNAQELFTPSGMKTLNVPLQEGDTVQVPRADHYFVFGEVRNPGPFKLEQGTNLTVFKAIGLAGGFTDKAARKGVKITRGDGAGKLVLKGDMDMTVRAQDIIVVPESFF